MIYHLVTIIGNILKEIISKKHNIRHSLDLKFRAIEVKFNSFNRLIGTSMKEISL